MAATCLSILGRSGDITITWDHADEAARERARAEVERLRDSGYSFFLVDGSPADELAAGRGTLIVRRLEPTELIDPPADSPATESPTESTSEPEAIPRRRRGRPPKAERQAIAVRPLQGG